MKKKLLLALTLVISGSMMSHAGPADKLKIPGPDPNGRRGATVPYNRYEAEDGSFYGSAKKLVSVNCSRDDIATQASKRSYVELTNGDSLDLAIDRYGDGVTMRFTMPDSDDGMGKNSSLEVMVYDAKGKKQSEQTVAISSYNMWQYFTPGTRDPHDEKVPGSIPAFAFDEVHFKLNSKLKPGDHIVIKNLKAIACGIDFIEVENIPAMIKQPAGAINVQDYKKDYNSWLDAFKEALKVADKSSKVLYIPKGTYELDGIWRVYGDKVRIQGAGMWYTNIKFTSTKDFGGGISGGHPDHGHDGYCKDMEVCDFYMTSNLRSRYRQMAVYKAFMDVWDNSYFHDLWVEHHECGFWFGDYNGKADYCNNVVVANCRIRNNFADGVNFCQGTSNAVVYNCNVRGNGDDGLAMFPDKAAINPDDEKNNAFAYNTVELGWRAGGIAIYGGTDQRAYNNYVSDHGLASGIHVTSDFTTGYRFDNNERQEGVLIENNYVVRCGTYADPVWNNDLSGIDVFNEYGKLRNITFRNNEVYDSPFFGVRVYKDPENILFDGLKLLGCGLSDIKDNFSTTEMSACAIRANNGSATFNNLVIANVGKDRKGNNSTWPVWTDNNKMRADAIKFTYLKNSYVVPEPPYADKTQQGGIIDPMDKLSGYNVKLEGLSWKNAKGSSNLKEGDAVTFEVKIVNTSNVDIPKGVDLAFSVKINGKSSFASRAYDGGLKAHQSIILKANGTWKAKAGACYVEAFADPENNLPKEISKEDNKRFKKFNVHESADDMGSFTPVTGGYDLVVTKILTNTKSIKPGDRVNFSAIVANAGDQNAPAGDVLGVQFQIDGKTDVITWSDDYTQGLDSHNFVKVTACGGTVGKEWTATEGKHTVTAWIDNYGGRYADEINHGNNKFTIELNIPMEAVQYISNPDKPDNLTGNPDENVDPIDNIKGYDVAVAGVRWEKADGNTDLKEGDKVTFKVAIKNTKNVNIPANVALAFKVSLDGGKQTFMSQSYDKGLKAGETVILSIKDAWTATPGSHVMSVLVDPENNLPAEVTKENNKQEKRFNVVGNSDDYGTFTPVTGGYDLVVTKILMNTKSIKPGDRVNFSAIVANAGDKYAPANDILGVQFQIDGKTDVITWSDDYTKGVKSHKFAKVTACGGTIGKDWIATEGKHTVTAWIDNYAGRYAGEVNHNNNKLTIELNIPTGAIRYINNADQPDNLDVIPTGIEAVNAGFEVQDTYYYDLQGRRCGTTAKGLKRGVYIHKGKKVVIK